MTSRQVEPAPPSVDDGARLIERGAELLHAQCWLWGQDLASPAGDLLLASGLERAAFVGARSHRSHYRGQFEDRCFVVAWSGGLLFGGSERALFFPRLRFAPIVLDGVRSLEDVPDLNRVDASSPSRLSAGLGPIVAAAINWLAAYEDGVVQIAGSNWRAECSRRWAEIEEGARVAAASVGVLYQPLRALPDAGLGGDWRELGSDCSRIT